MPTTQCDLAALPGKSGRDRRPAADGNDGSIIWLVRMQALARLARTSIVPPLRAAMSSKASAERIEELRANIDAIRQEVSAAAKGKGKEVR